MQPDSETQITDIEEIIKDKAQCKGGYLKVSQNVLLRYIEFTPRSSQLPVPVLFIPGWVSLPYSWRYFLPAAVNELSLIYLETREKRTSKISGDVDYSVSSFVNDIQEAISFFDLSDGQYVLAGSSLGATCILDLVPGLEIKPKGLFLILPNSYLPLPAYTPILKYIPAFLLPLTRRVVQSVVLGSKIDPSDIIHQEGFIKASNEADVNKLRNSALAIHGYRLNLDLLKQIQVPTVIIGAASDKQHNQGEIAKIAASLPLAELYDVETFAASHSTRAARKLIAFVSDLCAA